MQKILVTGSAGFIGFKVAEMLLQRGDFVVGIDNLNDYYDVTLKEYRLSVLNKYSNFSFYCIDIENLNDLTRLFQGNHFRSVYNLAARAGVRYSLDNPWVYFRTNVEGTLNILECMKETHVNKFILASTSSLYAGLPIPFKEELEVNTPISPYAASKKAAELLAYTYHKQYQIDVSVLRYFTVFGPLGRPDMAPYRFIKWILEEKPIVLYGDGTQSRDFTYIDDIARGTILAEKELGYEVINLGGGCVPTSINQFIHWIEELTGRNAKINYVVSHAADMEYTMADISKAKKLLGWQPTISVYDGLKQMTSHLETFSFKETLF